MRELGGGQKPVDQFDQRLLRLNLRFDRLRTYRHVADSFHMTQFPVAYRFPDEYKRTRTRDELVINLE